MSTDTPPPPRLALLVAIVSAAAVAVQGSALIRGNISAVLIVGTIASALSVWLALRNRPGPLMLLIAATGVFHLVRIGAPFVDLVGYNPGALALDLDEHGTIPAAVIIPIWITVFLLPFALVAAWGLRRAFAAQ